MTHYYYLKSSDFIEALDYQQYRREWAGDTLNLFCSTSLFWSGGPVFWMHKEAQAQASFLQKRLILWGEVGDNGGYALGALRMGYKHLIVDASSPLLIKLQQCAATLGATVRIENKPQL